MASKTVGTAVDPSNTCSSDEELRLAAANALANPFTRNAKRYDKIDVILADGYKETWEFICGGTFCAGTVINNAPVASTCPVKV